MSARGRRVVAVCAVLVVLGSGAGSAWAAQAPVRVPTVDPATYSFLSEQTDQLGVPGYAAGSELTPSGGIYTGNDEVDWLAGPHHAPFPVTTHTLADNGGAPVYGMSTVVGDVRYALTVLSAPAGGEPVDFVRVTATDLGAGPRTATWGSRLLYSGGSRLDNGGYAYRFAPLVAEDPGWTYVRTGRELMRSGQLAEVLPAGGTGSGSQVLYQRQLAPGASWTLDFTIPVAPVDPSAQAAAAISSASFPAVLAAELSYWHRFDAGAMGIQLPESKVTSTYDASLALLAESRYPAPAGAAGSAGWVQTPNKLQYNAFFIRDAAFIARAFDVVGLHGLAAEDLDYFPAVQTPDGLFESQPDQLDGAGEALWAIGQHAAWPGQAGFATAMLPAVARQVNWLAAVTASDPLGLIPPSTPDDNELTSGYITGDDFLAADGLSSAVALARVAGRPDLATAWQSQLSTFLAALHTALTHSEELTGGWIPPALEDNGGQNWGNLWGSYPLAVTLAPDSAAITATLKHVTFGFRDGIDTYGNVLHDYVGFRVFETELQRGEQADVVNGLYAELAHTTATGGGFELGIRRGAVRKLDTDMAPHGWFAAEYVTLLRNMLVDETGAHRVTLMSALSADWLKPGDVVAVSRASTTFGSVSFRLRSFSGGARLTWRSHLAPGTELAWPLPAATGVTRTLVLHGESGSETVHWRLRGSAPSFTATAAAVLANYPAAG